MKGKIALHLLCCMFFVTGCSVESSKPEEILQAIRGHYLELSECSGHSEMTADYGQRVYTYGVDFVWSREGDTTLVLTAPENIAGATVRISSGETALEFEDLLLETGPLNRIGMTPIDAIPVFLNYAREGVVDLCSIEENENGTYLHVICSIWEEDSTGENMVELWFSTETYALLCGEIVKDGMTVLQCEFTDFQNLQQENVPERNA